MPHHIIGKKFRKYLLFSARGESKIVVIKENELLISGILNQLIKLFN
ncbi:hypothetical protein BN1221_00584c [Brenneria goodwinii]|uniref:Uncharacterized protein n=1 Tax=Brenneria goodwinii TaxID=1109412 RepID=A0A0G4JQI4_9GAMM|nr:hypothetical protein BN1221_00584c [Brenneria goodwinii]